MPRIIRNLDISNEIKEKYLQGESIRNLASYYNIPKSTIASYIKKLGIGRHNLEWKNNEDKAKEAIKKSANSRRNIPIPKIRKYDIDLTLFENMNNSFDAYLFGILLTDGSIKNHTISIQVQKNDEQWLERISDKIRMPLKEYNGYPSLIFHGVELATRLKSMGCNENKTSNPIDIVIPPNEIDFLRGLIDGDGCIHIKSNGPPSVSIGGTNKVLIEWIASKFRQYNPKSHISLVNDRPSNLTAKKPYKLNFYETYIGGSFAVKLLKDIYYEGCFGIDRKIMKAEEGKKWQPLNK